MKKVLFLLSFLFVSFLGASLVNAQENEKIYFFYGQGCPHCEEVNRYFEENGIYDRYNIEKKEIYFDRENTAFFNQTLDNLGISVERRGVPSLVVGEKVISGDKAIISYFSDKEKMNQLADVNKGEQSDRGVNLTVFAVVAGSLADAINPCAFAVLIILLTTILISGDSKKALFSGFSFALAIFISYFLMGLGLYKALSLGGFAGNMLSIVGWFAIVLGLLNLKDFFWYGKGFLMEVPMAWRPKLKSIIKSVVNPRGAFMVGFLVSLFLLPCTSGPYIVILGMLAKSAMDVKAVSYLLLYNLIFVLPMVLITIAVYKGFDPKKAEEIRQKRLGTLHFVAGVIMLAMGFVILGGWI